jgi:hypothetical protein
MQLVWKGVQVRSGTGWHPALVAEQFSNDPRFNMPPLDMNTFILFL